ncbi:hypothetical protein [Actinoplanes sp. NPDC089786]|uniref:hypothetical protein n=1 Tax=Actinoplanes sp. NPDC089786 TaxID=3155185 RepID=UPI00342FA1F0
MLALDEARLRAAGLTRQRARYTRAVAAAVIDGSLDLDGPARLDDDAALLLPG